MKIRHVSIQNFRGVRNLDWSIDADLVCLIGPGDACKTTILDALELALSERFAVNLSDSDFYSGVVSPDSFIQIDVTIADLPTELLNEQRYGHWMRGVSPSGEIHDEPDDEDDEALTIRFAADSSLESSWNLYKKAREGDERTFSSRDREKLGVFRVDNENVAHLRWARGSALTKLNSAASPAQLIAEAQRAARAAVFDATDESISRVAKDAGEAIKELAATDMQKPRAGMELVARPWTTNLSLHDGEVPMTRAGLGTRRLAGAALQLKAFADRATILLDEVEFGLEPHRLRHLLLKLKRRQANSKGQVFLTTHSPQVVDFLDVEDLNVVRCDDGVVSVRRVPSELAGRNRGWPGKTLAQCPSALLSRRIVVGEGATEAGLLTAFTDHWSSNESRSPALAGAAIRAGRDNDGGTKAPLIASFFRELGFETLLFVDNDLTAGEHEQFKKNLDKARASGAGVAICEKGMNIETQIVSALPDSRLAGLLALAANEKGLDRQKIERRVANTLGVESSLDLRNPLKWPAELSSTLDQVRSAIASAATKDRWFKSYSGGYVLGKFLIANWDELKGSHLVEMIEQVRAFVLAPINPPGVDQEDDG